MSGPDRQDARARARRTLLHVALVNLVATVLTLGTGAVTGGTDLPGGGTMPLHHTLDAAGAALVVVLLGRLVLGCRVRARLLDAHLVDAGSTAARATAALRLPVDAAALAAAGWVLVSVSNAVAARLFGHSVSDALAFLAIYLLVGVAASVLTFLSVERDLRPVVASALVAGGREAVAVRVRTRLVLLWVVVAAIPLLEILTVALVPGVPDRTALVLLSLQALLAGPLLAVFVGDALESRLARLRDAVRSVRGGDLSVRVPVDDAGELGLLQAGFNEMVSGLQERDRAVTLLGRHVGVDVARRAMTAPDAPARSTVATMLFLDVVDSTGITERLPAGRVIAMLDALFEQAERVVREEHGCTNQFLGDGALCLFGVPEDDPQHATHALRAARRLAAAAAELAREHPDLRVAVGVSAGEVVAGNVGAHDRYGYTVIGSAVNEAARLVAAAKSRPGRVLAGARAVALAEPEEAVLWRPSGSVQLRGLTAATQVHEPCGSGGSATRDRAGAVPDEVPGEVPGATAGVVPQRAGTPPLVRPTGAVAAGGDDERRQVAPVVATWPGAAAPGAACRSASNARSV